MKKRPNILLTIADDQRGTALGCAGIEPVLTPHLDRLAARGVRFAQAQHFGSCHGAICAPSRAMLHTGLPYFRLERDLMGPAYPSPDSPIPPTLGEKLRQRGYRTFGTGKWHNGVRSYHRSFDAGATVFFGGMADHWFTPVHDFDPSGRYPQEAAKTANGFSTEVFAQSAIDFIRSRKEGDEPFFCYCAFTAPHDPRTPPDEWRRRYDPREIAPTPNMQPVELDGIYYKCVPTPLDFGRSWGRDERLLGVSRDWSEIRRSIAEYYGMISHMDEWIGRIHQALEETGLLENTLVIHTADHGLANGQHGLLGKQNPYQHSLRVPLLLAGPGIPAGQTPEALCYQHDLHPTLLEYAGATDEPDYFQSLRPLIDGRSAGRETIGNAFEDVLRTVRNRRHKLIESNVNGQRGTQLFDLLEDPWETRDLGADPSLEPVAAALRADLHRWQGECGDPAAWTGR